MNARDRAQFEDFMTSRWAGLVRLAFGLTGDRWLAEDLAQTALASAYASWWRVRRADDPDAYVRRILINASKSRWRRHRVDEQPAAPPAEIPDPGADPATTVGDRSALLDEAKPIAVRNRIRADLESLDVALRTLEFVIPAEPNLIAVRA